MLSIGIFGGTFDPIHDGHVAIGRRVRDELQLDLVLFVVANIPWQKSHRDVAPAEDRLRMVELALEGEEHLLASSIEIDRDGASYTIDTVRQLEKLHPGAKLWLVLGSDAAAKVPTWHRHEGLAESVELAIIARPDHEVEVPPGFSATVVEMEPNSISSTDIRDALAQGSIPEGLDRQVAEYIRNQRIYPQKPQQILDL